MSRFVVIWTASGLLLSLLDRILVDYISIGIVVLYLAWALPGMAFWVKRSFHARDPSRRSQSLRDRRLLTACGIGVVVLYGPLQSLGSRTVLDFRFKSYRPAYDSIVATLPKYPDNLTQYIGPTGEYWVDPGPPVRVGFVLPPGRFLYNWCGVVYDPTGQMVLGGPVHIFGVKLLGCSSIDAPYYHCCFT